MTTTVTETTTTKTTTKSTTARGYGWAHQKARKAALAWAVGSDCTRCGEKIESTEGIHYDHNDDRTGYLGWAHAYCNCKAGSDKAHRIRRTTVTKTTTTTTITTTITEEI
jgi:hypothetical protein